MANPKPGDRNAPAGHMTIGGMCADFARRAAALEARAARAGLNRREFLQALAAGAAGAAVSANGAWAAVEGAAEKSRVVVVIHPEVILKEYRVNPPVVRQMLDRGLAHLTGSLTEDAAWRRIGREDDFVVIKHNTMGRPTLHSHTEINDIVAERLAAEAQVNPDRILAVDRRVPPPFGEFAEPVALPSRGLTTRLRRLYTDHATAIVNVSVLKCHSGVGVSASMKNHLGSINNPSAFHGWEPGQMPVSVPELNALEPLRRKTRLCVIDAVRPLFAGGPADKPEYRWTYNALILSTDPVAATAVGLGILEAKRAQVSGRPWPLEMARRMVANAAAIGLGRADPEGIDLVEVDMA